MTRKRLSAMEHTVLGIAWKRGQCTTYALMKELAASTSTFYKERAGSVYPLVERLIKSGMLSSSSEKGARGEKLVAITDLGEAALRHWLLSEVSSGEASHTVDLLRLRTFYLGGLEPAQRTAFVDEAISALKEHLNRCQSTISQYQRAGDEFSAIATEGVAAETLARIEWLLSVRERLKHAKTKDRGILKEEPSTKTTN